MGSKLISLSFKPSTELPELDELKTYLETDFVRQLPGFAMLETDAKWGDSTISLLGKDESGTLVAVFPSVSRQERDFHDVLSQSLVATSWLEDNKDEIQNLYGAKGVNPSTPLRMILVAPVSSNRSRTVTRALERAGVEVMDYSIFEIDTSDGPVRAVSFDSKNAPASAAAPSAAAPAAAAARPVLAPDASSALAASAEPPREAPPAPKVEAKPEPPRQPSPVEVFISSMADPNLKAMSEQILTFLMSRFPSADASMSPGDRGFTLNVQAAHLATIRLDKSSLWLEVGPEKIPTNKIKDPATLERAMNLPSVLEALQSVHS